LPGIAAFHLDDQDADIRHDHDEVRFAAFERGFVINQAVVIQVLQKIENALFAGGGIAWKCFGDEVGHSLIPW
jgi:hypothetical protein